MRMIRRSRRRSSTGIPEITLTPLIDTALTLLIIFMVTSPMLNNGIKVDLPKGKVKEDLGLQEDIVLHLDKENHLFLDNQPIKKDQLATNLKKKVGNKKNKTVYIKADKECRYGPVMELVDRVKVVEGIERVALPTQNYA